MIYYNVLGSFKESQITAGNSYADSLRSVNTVNHSKLRFSAFVAHTHSATLANYGNGPLNHFRYVLTMREATDIAADIEEKLQAFLRSRKNIVGPGMADADVLISMHNVNSESARARNAIGTPGVLRIPETGG